jgi:hypothetical protein
MDRAVVEILEICAPSYRPKLSNTQGLTLAEMGEAPFQLLVSLSEIQMDTGIQIAPYVEDDRSYVVPELHLDVVDPQFEDDSGALNIVLEDGSEDLEFSPTRVLLDIFHLMKRIKVSRWHGWRLAFSRCFRDAIFIMNKEQKDQVTKALESKGRDFEKTFEANPEYILKRVQRHVIRDVKVLEERVTTVFKFYGPKLDRKTNKPLFN